ncbi:hypothetical protein [Mycoplasmoides alvi]|uniref:hypothetical protein n=1 Tax=Mycoplasmoides alvi TaxID=78580 RepID=UPI00051ACB6A|nr:hypothetical protein [Mycoplasmoides alvi]
MSEYRVVIKNIYISFIVNVISLAISFATSYITNQFLGTTNYGFMGIATALLPYISLLLSGVGSLTVYRLYEPLSKKNYLLANELMQRSLYEYRTRGVISFLLLLLLAVVYPYIIGLNNPTDSLISSLIILAAGLSSLFSFLLSPIYQQILYVERRGYLLQTFDLFGKIFFNSIFIAIVLANNTYQFIGNNKWLLIISAFSGNLLGSFGIIIAFCLRKKIAPWFVPKILKKEVGDKVIRRQILADAFIAQFVVNTSFFIFGIFGQFTTPQIASTLAGIFGTYFVVKNSVSSILSIVVSTPATSYARIYHSTNKEYVKFAYNIYDYSCFIFAIVSMIYVMLCSPFLTSFIVNNPSTNLSNLNQTDLINNWPTPDQLLNNSFNLWISLLVGLSCFIDLARSSPENTKSISGEYKWKFKFAIVEAIINVALSIINTIIAFYFPNLMNGLYLIFGLILSNLLAVGFRYIAIKLSTIKTFFINKQEYRFALLKFIFIELIFVLVIGITFTLIASFIFTNKPTHLSLNSQTILMLFLVFVISSTVVAIVTFVLVVINPSFRKVVITKLTSSFDLLKEKIFKKT